MGIKMLFPAEAEGMGFMALFHSTPKATLNGFHTLSRHSHYLIYTYAAKPPHLCGFSLSLSFSMDDCPHSASLHSNTDRLDSRVLGTI